MHLAKRNPSLTTYGSTAYRNEIKKFNRWLGGRKISPEMILQYFQELKLSPSSRNVAKYALKNAIKSGVNGQNRLIDVVKLDALFKQIKTGKADKKVNACDLVTEEEMKLISDRAPKRAALLCEFLYKTGLRIAEAASIELKNCKTHNSVVHIQVLGKGSKVRTVLIDSGLFLKIREIYRGSRYLFGKPDNKGFSTRYLRKLVSSAGSIIGREIWPHLLRHSFASATASRCNKIQALSNYLGHSSPSITLSMYVHQELTTADLRLDEVA